MTIRRVARLLVAIPLLATACAAPGPREDTASTGTARTDRYVVAADVTTVGDPCGDTYLTSITIDRLDASGAAVRIAAPRVVSRGGEQASVVIDDGDDRLEVTLLADAARGVDVDVRISEGGALVAAPRLRLAPPGDG